ncbi:ATP-binding cassette domain-containing protein [Shewanella sp. 3_MG-2023]|uniref:ATP-binding cassette domain-containing protein n=1 Tax=Shewanella sp. 3_MG-2023 TaxID=3062635 RepID=UPI0034C69D68
MGDIRPSLFGNCRVKCQLQQVANQLHFTLSGGQKQRLLLALSLVNDPALLFFR